jgi:stearoyl-CoA desaturase (delta-9 desaturase)
MGMKWIETKPVPVLLHEYNELLLFITTAFTDLFSRIGWAYDLKTVPMCMVKKRVERTGDDSHEIWGWGNRDMSQEDMDEAQVINK